jgi:hypothetical protein
MPGSRRRSLPREEIDHECLLQIDQYFVFDATSDSSDVTSASIARSVATDRLLTTPGTSDVPDSVTFTRASLRLGTLRCGGTRGMFG